MKLLFAYFTLVLQKSSEKCKKDQNIVIVLDSLDQLSNEGQPQGQQKQKQRIRRLNAFPYHK